MTTIKNQYNCPKCNERWEDYWDCECDDECPNCDTICIPLGATKPPRTGSWAVSTMNYAVLFHGRVEACFAGKCDAVKWLNKQQKQAIDRRKTYYKLYFIDTIRQTCHEVTDLSY